MRKRRNPRGNGLLLVGVLAVGGLALAGTQGVGPLKSLASGTSSPKSAPGGPTPNLTCPPNDPCLLAGGMLPGGTAAY